VKLTVEEGRKKQSTLLSKLSEAIYEIKILGKSSVIFDQFFYISLYQSLNSVFINTFKYLKLIIIYDKLGGIKLIENIAIMGKFNLQ
jgi:hypothetical protein